jgi:regulator of PEP synthase PpsR (kinase-PPPase family)
VLILSADEVFGTYRYTLDSYERFDKMFLEMADHVIDCTSKSIEEVAAEVNALVMSSR